MSEVVRQDYRANSRGYDSRCAIAADQSGKFVHLASSLFPRRVDRWTTAVVNFSTITPPQKRVFQAFSSVSDSLPGEESIRR